MRATRAAGPEGLAAATALHRGWMRREGTTTWEGKSGYGLDRDTELAQLRAVRSAGGVPTWLGAHAVPPEYTDAVAYLDFVLAEVLPEAAQLAEAADVSSSGGLRCRASAQVLAFVACHDAGLALRLHGDQFTESGAIPSRSTSARAPSTTWRRPAPTGSGMLAGSDVTAVLPCERALPRPCDAARAVARRYGAAVALATDFNPGSAFCESLPLVCSLACTQLRLAPAEALAACTVNAAHVLGLAGRKARPRV